MRSMRSVWVLADRSRLFRGRAQFWRRRPSAGWTSSGSPSPGETPTPWRTSRRPTIHSRTFEPVLERAFSQIRIGVFDVRLARTFLRDKSQAEQFREVCLALVDLQTKWIERFSEAGSNKKQVVSDLIKLRKWLARARLNKKAMREPSGDLIEYLGGSQRERELAASISQAMISGNGLGFSLRRRPAKRANGAVALC